MYAAGAGKRTGQNNGGTKRCFFFKQEQMWGFPCANLIVSQPGGAQPLNKKSQISDIEWSENTATELGWHPDMHRNARPPIVPPAAEKVREKPGCPRTICQKYVKKGTFLS